MIMAKDKTIMIEFDQEIQNAEGNHQAFTVTGRQYKYINGPLIDVTYPVISTELVPPPSSGRTFVSKADFDAGVYTNTQYSSGLTLAGAD